MSTTDGSPAFSTPGTATFPDIVNTALTSALGSFVTNSYLYDSIRLLLLGYFMEMLRRVWQWLTEKFRLRYAITAHFHSPDPTYEWIILFLTQENVWRKSRNFQVTAKTSQRKWGVHSSSKSLDSVDYVPSYNETDIFRWQGYWIEINRQSSTSPGWMSPGALPSISSGSITLTIFTLDMSVLSSLVEEAHHRYITATAPHVIIHTADSPSYGPFQWDSVKHKRHRPLSTIILEEGVIESIVKDARDFFDMEAWYVEAGIPHHRGWLLYGPPGTGKTSTIFALAGELGLEIYSLSLASGFVDDSYLLRAVASMPKNSILLIEDIDCAFSSREDADEDDFMFSTPGVASYLPYSINNPKRANVTLSGLLNVIDGVGSEEGKLFFATTNYIDRLDPALLRPGRIDVKVQYHLATHFQARALFDRFFPTSRFGSVFEDARSDVLAMLKAHHESSPNKLTTLSELSTYFAESIPEGEFSTAELQGYLMAWKMHPVGAALHVHAWVQEELAERLIKKAREDERKRKIREARERTQRGVERPVVVNINDGKMVPPENRQRNGSWVQPPGDLNSSTPTLVESTSTPPSVDLASSSVFGSGVANLCGFHI